ncbi:diguanylate cyclase (GGDEF)-like protein [Nakamurella sp. UYEF19]|uniref:sensor domain-containing diguanylate cyclase n=1 Tax=Nakamurella sp. UYEF19 TaxID=1756392 RepID=UPI0033944218
MHNLSALARSLSQVTTLEQLLEVAGEEIRAGLDCSTVSISRLEPGAGMLRTLINVGDLGPSEQRWPKDEVYTLQNFLNLQGIVSNLQMWTMTIGDPEAEPSEVRLLEELGKKTAMGAPLIVDDTLWGELYVTYAEADLFGAGDKAYVEVCVAVLESAITKVLQIRVLERLAFRDPLTGLANRRALDEAAESAYGLLAGKNMLRVSVVAIDLNGLKNVNDTVGHAEGDRLITSAAAAIQNQFNRLPGSLTARVGGDEFVVLVPSHSTEIVAAAAEAAVASIADLELGDGASCGIAVAQRPHIDESVAALLARADSAQYESKRSGALVIVEAPASPPRAAGTGHSAQTAS